MKERLIVTDARADFGARDLRNREELVVIIGVPRSASKHMGNEEVNMKVYAWTDEFVVHLSTRTNPFASCQIELDESLFKAYESITASFWAMQDRIEDLYLEEMERKKEMKRDVKH